MRLLLARFLCLVVTGSSLCAIATCTRRDVPPVQAPEIRPAGPRPARAPELPMRKSPSEHIRLPMDATPAAFEVVPAAVSPKKPPIDAGVDDAIVPLPPLPDAVAPIVRDAATPM